MAPPTSRRVRRAYGTGSVFIKGNRWYGQWSLSGKPIKRSLGPVKSSVNPQGLTQTEAEKRLREKMAEVEVQIGHGFECLTFEDAANRHIARLEALGRKRSTLTDYRGHLRVHINPVLGQMRVDKIRKADIERFMYAKLASGLSAKSVRNILSVVHGVLAYCQKQEIIQVNPASLIDKPAVEESNPDFKFLNLGELDDLLEAVTLTKAIKHVDGERQIVPDLLGLLDRTLYLTAAMTGIRQGELIALRWRDVDWLASRIRVRRNFSLGEYGTPKTTLSGKRSVPLAEKVARELEAHSKRSAFTGDDELVFAYPATGGPYDKSKLLKRFKKIRDAAGVTPITFHGLRHTFGTRMASAGVPIRTIQEWMGHKDIETTEKYAHYAPGDQDSIYVERAFGGEGIERGIDLKSAGVSPRQQEATGIN